VCDLQIKITEFLAPDRVCPVFWSGQGKGQALIFLPLPWPAQARSVQKGWLAGAGQGTAKVVLGEQQLERFRKENQSLR